MCKKAKAVGVEKKWIHTADEPPRVPHVWVGNGEVEGAREPEVGPAVARTPRKHHWAWTGDPEEVCMPTAPRGGTRRARRMD